MAGVVDKNLVTAADEKQQTVRRIKKGDVKSVRDDAEK